MKKIILTLSIFICGFCSTKAQDIYFVNNTDVDIYLLIACGASPNCVDAVSAQVTIPCYQSVNFSMNSGGAYTPVSWNTPPPAGALFTLVRYFDAQSGCPGGVNVRTVGDGTCAKSSVTMPVTSPCVTTCATATPPPSISAIWNQLPPLDASVTFN